jgi:hypothetical protein
MRKRTVIAIVAIAAAVAVPAVVVAASSAYVSATLKIRYAGTATVISASSSVSDDATARAAIYIPTGTTITSNQAPGTQLGTVNAQVSALDLGGALLPLTGPILVAPPGAVPAATQAACTAGETPSAVWLLQLAAAGQTINLPAFLIPANAQDAALGVAKLVFCLAPPDLPAGDPRKATFGAKFLSAELTVNGVFSPVTTGAWIGIWTPWTPGAGVPNPSGTIASPAAIAPGSVTLKGRKAAGKRTLSGVVSQGGVGFANKVTVWGAVNKAAFRRIGVVTAKANGAFTYAVPKASKATSFQARASAPARSAPPLCAALAALPYRCVNPTVNGFTAQSKVVALKP